jgi:hypothetical protein
MKVLDDVSDWEGTFKLSEYKVQIDNTGNTSITNNEYDILIEKIGRAAYKYQIYGTNILGVALSYISNCIKTLEAVDVNINTTNIFEAKDFYNRLVKNAVLTSTNPAGDPSYVSYSLMCRTTL